MGEPRQIELLKMEIEAQRKIIVQQQKELDGFNASTAIMPETFAKMASVHELAGPEQAIRSLRSRLMDAQNAVINVHSHLMELLPEYSATSRAGYLRSLPELIGPPPPDRTWKDEWVPLKAESYRLSGQGEGSVEEDEKYVRTNDTIEQFIEQQWVKDDVQELIKKGWPKARAECYTLLFTCAEALSRALSEMDPCYAASTYALSETLFAMRQGADVAKDMGRPHCSSLRCTSNESGRTLDLFVNRDGLFSVTERDEGWQRIEIPDGTGFRGLTSCALTHGTCDPRCFCEDGFIVSHADEEGNPLSSPQDSDVICFESHADDDHGH